MHYTSARIAIPWEHPHPDPAHQYLMAHKFLLFLSGFYFCLFAALTRVSMSPAQAWSLAVKESQVLYYFVPIIPSTQILDELNLKYICCQKMVSKKEIGVSGLEKKNIQDSQLNLCKK